MAKDEPEPELDDDEVPLSDREKEQLGIKRAKFKRAHGHTASADKIEPLDAGELARAEAAARGIIAQRQAMRERDIMRSRKTEDCVWYVECDYAPCQGPGIWVFSDPGAPLEDKDWESTYHPKGAYWPLTSLPHCQCCEAALGQRVKLDMYFSSTGEPGQEQRLQLMCNMRQVRKLTRAEYEALVAEGAEKTEGVAHG